ncbi:MAG TPA: DUF420 domain-containing protein [Candidatus Acidoferrales bacterium]|nr:DUF420 domain-containing protein [Candidatus Acidoferrales bacterium]
MKGFLGTPAGFSADVNLVLQIAMGIALLAGALLARSKRYSAHGACMAAVLLLNLVMIVLVMWPSFHELVLPRIPARLARQYYAVATLHGALGAATELFGLYILLVAGTEAVPQRWRFRRWKLWMRVELAIWWVVLLSGIGTYFLWYGAPHLPL